MTDPAIAKFLAALEETQYLAPDRMEAYQRRLLDRLLRHARAETSFYADRLAPVFRPDDSIDWERWTEIPIFTRSEAQANEDALFAREVPLAVGASLTDSTSGSTGRPLRHGNSSIQNLATACANERFKRWHKLDLGSLVGLIYHADAGKDLYPDGEMTVQSPLTDESRPTAKLTIDTPVAQQIGWLRRTKPAIIASLPSNLREIGRIAEEQGEPFSFQAVMTFGEAISPSMRADLIGYFGKEPLDQYGTTELGHIAGTCPHSGRYHVSADLVRLEIVDDDGRPAEAGMIGRIVATSFYNYATPFIRYDTGDLGIMAAEPCGCGRTLSVIDTILGRTRNIFRFVDGTTALPRLESSKVQPFVPHRQFQVVQTALDRIEYRYVPAGPGQTNDIAGLTDFVRRRLHPSLTVVAIAMDAIPRSPSGKYEDYVSLVQGSA